MTRLKKKAGDYYHNVREIAEKNKRLFDKKKLDKCVSFVYNGYTIYDPFKDEKGKKEVDPLEYYGEAFEQSEFNKIN